MEEALIQYKNVEIHQQELCVLSMWLEFLRAHRRDEAPLWHAWVGAFFCPVLFSGCVELLQEYCTSYRGGDWLDFAANSTGALLASLVAYYVVRPRMMKQ